MDKDDVDDVVAMIYLPVECIYLHIWAHCCTDYISWLMQTNTFTGAMLLGLIWFYVNKSIR